MVRGPYTDAKNGLKKGAWSKDEDDKLKSYLRQHHHGNWRQLPRNAGLNRCGKSCRLRWKNYLKPGVRRGNYTPEEDELILKLHQEYGNKWSMIASQLAGRTDNDIKNRWHSHLMRRQMTSTRPSSSTHDRDHHTESPSASTSSTITFDDSMEQHIMEPTESYYDHDQIIAIDELSMSSQDVEFVLNYLYGGDDPED